MKFRDYAIETRADSIIIGGDIAPIGFGDSGLINGQRHFLEKRLPKFLLSIKKKLPNSRIFLMMGNDDCATNLDVLEKNDPNIFHIIHWKRLKLTEEFDIVGYSFVPITPFDLKDWEKYDLSEIPENLLKCYEQRKITNYNVQGYRSAKLRWEKFKFTSEMEK
jgi:Icc-related predicted phosphoesterase